jgi:tyrosyl-tRNA synthetase
MSIIKDLESRNLIHSVTDLEGVTKHLNDNKPVTFYAGFDPTADSLHVGSLLPIITMARFQKAGHKPLALVGGATGMIGDPSGKSEERNLLTEELLQKNVEGIRNQLSRFLDMDNPENGADVVNNGDWFKPINFIEFLRDIGKHFSVNAMMAKDSVKSRLENREQGISYTEFSYMLLQAYDFLHLCSENSCTLQIGGSDQWGNITAGIDLIRRKTGKQAYGLTIPLLTTSSGKKFGKTEKGTVWLDAKRTSPYQFYQYWVQSEDDDVMDYLYKFSFLPVEEIKELEKQHLEAPHRRVAQKKLAELITVMVHGSKGLENALMATNALFGGDLSKIPGNLLGEIFSHVPSFETTFQNIENKLLIELMAESEFVKSKGEARRLIKGGGVYLNNIRIQDMNKEIVSTDLLENRYLVLRSGKKRYHLIKTGTGSV